MFKFLRKRKLKSAIEGNKHPHAFQTFEDINNVLILFENKHLNDVEYIVKDLLKSGKKVFLWTHNSDKKAVSPQRQSFNLQTITGGDVSMSGSIKPDILSVFQKQQYDTVMDLTQEPEYPLEYLLASNKAQFCVGIKRSESKLYDFVLLKNDDMSIKDAFLQIKFYLNNMCKGANN